MKTVFFDIDTQLDFLSPSGALYVPHAESILPAVAALNRHAAAHGIPVVSTTDAHTEDDPEFADWPPHCIAGTLGQHKPQTTLLDRRVVVPNVDALPAVEGAEQIVAEKQTVQVCDARSVRNLVAYLNADAFVVYGVVTEICVLSAAQGLLRTGKPVTVVTDAVAALDPADSRRALQEIASLGGRFTTVGELLA